MNFLKIKLFHDMNHKVAREMTDLMIKERGHIQTNRRKNCLFITNGSIRRENSYGGRDAKCNIEIVVVLF
jgi:hypothetical protein